MAPRRRIDGPVMDKTKDMAIQNEHWTPSQIHRAVNEGADPERVSLRTVQRLVAEVRAGT